MSHKQTKIKTYRNTDKLQRDKALNNLSNVLRNSTKPYKAKNIQSAYNFSQLYHTCTHTNYKSAFTTPQKLYTTLQNLKQTNKFGTILQQVFSTNPRLHKHWNVWTSSEVWIIALNTSGAWTMVGALSTTSENMSRELTPKREKLAAIIDMGMDRNQAFLLNSMKM